MCIRDRNCDVNLLRRRVGMVFQKPNPFPMSIYDNIAYGPRTHGIKSRVQLDEIVETSLKRAAIWEETKNNLKKSALSMSCLLYTSPRQNGSENAASPFRRYIPDGNLQLNGYRKPPFGHTGYTGCRKAVLLCRNRIERLSQQC